MELSEVIAKRRSIRAFRPLPIEDEKLQRILEAACSAPSAGNLQAYEIILVRDLKVRISLARAALSQLFMADAPVILVFAANQTRSASKYGRRGAELYSIQDATIACAYAQLAATDLGLGSVWIGAFDEQDVRQILNLPPELRPVAMLPIGYPGELPPPSPRRPLSSMVHVIE